MWAERKHQVAERNTLVTSPPGERQQKWIDRIKQSTDEMNCVEITITFKPKLQNTTDLTLKEIVNGTLINILAGEGYATLIHEYSNAGLFHYHGIISGVSRKKISTIRKQFTLHIGRIEIKTIKYFESYLRYMTKGCDDLDHDDELNINI